MNGTLSLSDGRRIEVRHGLTFGRVAGNDVVLDDSKASRRHARLVVEAGVVEIEDLGSSNGTLLNGKPVTRKLVRNGDEIQIGSTVMKYSAAGAAAGGAAGAAAPADDNDLFGGGEAVAAAAPVVPVVPRAPIPPVQAAPPVPPPPPVAAPMPPKPPPPPAPAPPPKPAVVEFEDEVIEVKQPARAAAAPPPLAGGEPKVQVQQRILQFQNKKVGNSVLGDDLGQMGGGMRMVIVVLVLAAAAGLGWLAMTLVG